MTISCISNGNQDWWWIRVYFVLIPRHLRYVKSSMWRLRKICLIVLSRREWIQQWGRLIPNRCWQKLLPLLNGSNSTIKGGFIASSRVCRLLIMNQKAILKLKMVQTKNCRMMIYFFLKLWLQMIKITILLQSKLFSSIRWNLIQNVKSTKL